MRLRLGLNLKQLVASGAAAPAASPALKFNVAANSQYVPIVAF